MTKYYTWHALHTLNGCVLFVFNFSILGDYADLGCANPLYDNDDSSSQFLGVAMDGFPIYR